MLFSHHLLLRVLLTLLIISDGGISLILCSTQRLTLFSSWWRLVACSAAAALSILSSVCDNGACSWLLFISFLRGFSNKVLKALRVVGLRFEVSVVSTLIWGMRGSIRGITIGYLWILITHCVGSLNLQVRNVFLKCSCGWSALTFIATCMSMHWNFWSWLSLLDGLSNFSWTG